MLDNTKRKNNHLTLKEKVRVVDTLKDRNIIVPCEDGVGCYYVNGWSDTKVAKRVSQELGITVTQKNVVGVRLEMLGVILHPGMVARSTASDQKMKELEAYVLNVQSEIRNLRQWVEGTIGKTQSDLISLRTRHDTDMRNISETLNATNVEVGKVKLHLRMGGGGR